MLRYFFCRFVATEHREVKQFVECGHVDLVLRRVPHIAFIELKFYIRPRRFDPYDATEHGFKGAPGRKNLAEFRACIDELHARRSEPHLSKYVILVYTDPPDRGRLV